MIFLILFLQIHTKERNRLEQQSLNDLVFVKYNRALRRRFDERDKLDPISLQKIDENNEWLTERMDGESDEDDELVHGDDDGLTWGNVATASGLEKVVKELEQTLHLLQDLETIVKELNLQVLEIGRASCRERVCQYV